MIGTFQYLYPWSQWNFSSSYLWLPSVVFPDFSLDALGFFWHLLTILSSSASFILSNGCFRKVFQCTVSSVSFAQSLFLLCLKPETVSSSFLFPSTPSTVLMTYVISLHVITTVPIPVLLWNLVASGLQNFVDKSKWLQVEMKAIILFQGLTHKLRCSRMWNLLFPAHPTFYFRNLLSLAWSISDPVVFTQWTLSGYPVPDLMLGTRGKIIYKRKIFHCH